MSSYSRRTASALGALSLAGLALFAHGATAPDPASGAGAARVLAANSWSAPTADANSWSAPSADQGWPTAEANSWS